MAEEKSWIAPAAFCTFGGIFLVATFSFLKLEGLLFTERGAALVAWLTLITTMLAFTSALSALFIALRQMRDGQTQAEIAMIENFHKRLDRITKYKNSAFYFQQRRNDYLPKKINEATYGEIIRIPENYSKFLDEVEDIFFEDHFGDIFEERMTIYPIAQGIQKIFALFDAMKIHKTGNPELFKNCIKEVFDQYDSILDSIFYVQSHAVKREAKIRGKLSEIKHRHMA
ncbi:MULTISPECIES: hypothetical protein [unclassified Labrenzia]|uniref:hypothetical protein n=1 Tax=unclassified Labrenzia TaxID=2648686 RepID=UPI0012682A9B|nr:MULTISPECIES: hypothetical protein [unclassified Labrenzia]